MIAYEGSTVPVPMMPRAIAELYVKRFGNHARGYQTRWLRQHEERGLGFDFTTEVFEAAEQTLKTYFIDPMGAVHPDWATMIEHGTVDNLRLDFVSLDGIFHEGISVTQILNDLVNGWEEEPYRWPVPSTFFAQSGTQVAFIWIVWHMHWLLILEMLRSITEFDWRKHE